MLEIAFTAHNLKHNAMYQKVKKIAILIIKFYLIIYLNITVVINFVMIVIVGPTYYLSICLMLYLLLVDSSVKV